MTIELHRRPACLREAFMLYFRRNRPLIALRVLLGFLAFAILLLSFVLLSLEGLMWGAGLGQILAVYPRFLVNEGYLGALLPVAVMLVLLSPRVLGWIAGAQAGRPGAPHFIVLSIQHPPSARQEATLTKKCPLFGIADRIAYFETICFRTRIIHFVLLQLKE